MKYRVGITIYQSIEVEADSEQEARGIITDMSDEELLFDSDFNITYVDIIEEQPLSLLVACAIVHMPLVKHKLKQKDKLS